MIPDVCPVVNRIQGYKITMWAVFEGSLAQPQYPLTATHPTLPKPIKPFILGYSVIAIVLLSSVPGKACLYVCSVTLLASPKLEVRALIEE